MIMRWLAGGSLGSWRFWLFCRILTRRWGHAEDRWARDRKHRRWRRAMCEESGDLPGVEGIGFNQEKLEKVMEEWCACVLAVGEAWARIFHDTLVPAMDEVMRVVEAVSVVWWEQYRDAGNPYGDDEESMLRWVRDQLEIIDPPGG